MICRWAAALGVSAIVTSAAPVVASAQAEPPSVRPALKLVTLTRVHLEVCDLPGSLDTADAQAIVDEAFDQVAVALIERTVRLGVSRDTAETKIAAYLTTQRRDIDDPERFRSSCPPDVAASLTTLSSAGFQQYLSEYAASDPHYDRPFELADSGLTTFASPQTQRKLLLSLSGSFDGCSKIKVDSTELIQRTVLEADGWPAFVKAPILYRERWVVTCGAETVTFEVKHQRSSEGPRGAYTVLRSEP